VTANGEKSRSEKNDAKKFRKREVATMRVTARDELIKANSKVGKGWGDILLKWEEIPGLPLCDQL